MNLFKALFNWFNSEEREEIKNLKEEVVEIKNLHKELLSEIKLYKSRIHTGDTTIVVTNDGKILEKEDKDKTIYNSLNKAKSEAQIINTLSHDPQNNDIPIDAYNVLYNSEDFTFKDDKVFYKEVKVPIPELILAEFIFLLEKLKLAKSKGDKKDIENYEDLYNRVSFFWLKVAYSPMAEVDNILTFIKKNDIRLSRRGNIVGYRRVKKWSVEKAVKPIKKSKTVKKNSELDDFIIEQWNKVKKAKKSPKNYNVYDDNGYVCIDNKKKHDYNKFIGVLSELKDSLTEVPEVEVKEEPVVERQLYTSSHNSGKYVFGIGDVYKMEGEEPDMNVGNCASGGLHGAAVNYDYGSFGDTPVVVLINPAKAIFVTPRGEEAKFRCSEMKIACINPNGRGIHVKDELIEEADKEYNEYSINELYEIVKNDSFRNIIPDSIAPKITVEMVDLKKIAEMLKNKVVNI